MKQSRIKFVWNDNYNMNCDINELEKLGFINTTYHNDLAPSYTNKKGKDLNKVIVNGDKPV